MSETTVIQLVVAQREKEMRAIRRWEAFDLLALPLASVFALGIAAAWIVFALACSALTCFCSTNVLTDAAGSPHGHL